ncbi:MAG: S41 family peptidase [candidate division Zixibacteria bacterium]
MKQSASIFGTLLIFLISFTILTVAEDIKYARYPALSPDGSTIAFSYFGDIWTVPSGGGEATRLTIHDAVDARPFYSPDGKYILFTSWRFNNADAFIIPAEGGQARQITFHTSYDYGSGWTPEGDSVIINSGREGRYDIYKVDLTGGTPIKLTGYHYASEYNGRITPDGKYLIFNVGSTRWWRRDLKASIPANIYIQDRTKEKFTSRRLTNEPRHNFWPAYNAERSEVYYVSCPGNWAQVWKIPFGGGEAEALTNFKGDGVQWLNSNPQGTKLVFEQGFDIWLFDPADGKPKRIPISIRSDERFNLVETKLFKSDIDWYSISPDEKKIATIIHGEIFILPAKDPEDGFRITNTPAREITPVWGSDSKTLYYSSDRNGNYDLYSVDVTTKEEKQLTSSDENDVKPLVSPDGKYLAFYRGLNKLMRYDIESGSETTWIEGNFYDLSLEPDFEYDWSPDSKWLTFTMTGPTYEMHIYAITLDGEPQLLSKSSGWSFAPRFSKDGKIVYFSNYFEGDVNTYKIDLQHEPLEFYESSFDSLFIEEPEDKKKENGKDKKDKKDKDDKDKSAEETIIDFTRIEKRRSLAFNLSGSSRSPVLAPDGEKYVFVASLLGEPELWSVNTEDKINLKQLTHSKSRKSLLRVSEDSKSVFYLEDDKIKKIGIDGNKKSTVSFSAVMDIDLQELNRQKFRESWQMLNSFFYDKEFHGTDWDDVRKKYEPLVDHVRSDREFRDVVLEMMGELRASHLNIYSRDPGTNRHIVTTETGILLDYEELDENGEFRIGRIVPESPAAIAGIKAGQYIVKIDDHKLKSGDNFFTYLSGKRGKRLTLTIGNKAGKEDTSIVIKPISRGALTGLKYNEIIEDRRRLVDSLSDKRLAYIHISAMSSTWLRRFKQELIAYAEEKDGLIIDVRDNGGGNIAVHLLGMLARKPFFIRSFRDFPTTSETKYRSKAFEKPMNVLINGGSASNSEIFAEGFRELGLGKVIGEPTAGAVIGTGSYYLIDGTRIRRPSTGAYTVDMEDTDLAPRQPDILVERLPDDFMNGRDPQLVRAVKELLKEL